MLERAFRSVVTQSFKDFVWVIVNDAGEPGPVDAIAGRAHAMGVDVMVVHRTASTGMEAASNAGLAATQSEYIVIHDDDDSWDPEFLARTTAFLDAEPIFVGVVTGYRNVAERLRDNTIHRITVWNTVPVFGALQMAELVQVNPIPPICFLYRREVLVELVGYREDLPVLGDWEFLLRVLMRGDIAGIPDFLAFYHHRFSVKSGPMGNSVYAARDVHARHDALLRNALLREDIASGRVGLGHLLFEGRIALLLKRRVDSAWLGPLRGLRKRFWLAIDSLAERLGR